MKSAMATEFNSSATGPLASHPLTYDPSSSADVADVGILLFNSARKLIYMDSRARGLSADINLSESGYSANGILPSSLTMVVTEIVQGLQARTDTTDPRPIQVRRLLSDIDHPILLRGYGFPKGVGKEDAGVLILMEDITPRKEFRSKQAAERFHLTEREVQIVKNLSKGYTNKEIASALAITEQAVKEVIKRIMLKTNTTTRTGILMKIMGV
jgi:DNA-binding CsgD family transcriptional regulator